MLITLKHKQERERIAAAHQAAAASKNLRPATVLRAPKAPAGRLGTDATVIAAALVQDLDVLKQLTDVKDKCAVKRELVPKWREVVDQYRASGARYPFQPLVRLVIWLIDIEQMDQAIEYADFAIAQQQLAPEGFKRDLATYVAEELHNWAERQYKAGHSAEPFYGQLVDRVETEKWLVSQVIVLSKIYRLAGMFAERAGDLRGAERAYLKCTEVNPEKHGVKTKLAAVQAKLARK